MNKISLLNVLKMALGGAAGGSFVPGGVLFPLPLEEAAAPEIGHRNR